MTARFDPLPSECLVDEMLAIRLRGLPAHAPVTLRLCNAGLAGKVFMSHANFVSDAQGVVDLTVQAPVSGTYRGVDPMGLFWSRGVLSGAEAAAVADVHPDPAVATLVAEGEGAMRAAHAVKRGFSRPDVTCREVRDNGLVGKMFEPAGPGPFPAVLVLGGSEGGLVGPQGQAALLASHGFSALALAYFNAEGLPSTLERIALEYFGTALDWLAAQPKVNPGRIGALGVSRGGELALLLGATYPRIGAVVCFVGSGIVWPGIARTDHGAWTWGGDEVPFARGFTPAEWDQAVADGRVREGSFDWYFVPLQDEAYAEAASIAVERINGPVLLISGNDDKLWPSAELSEYAVRRCRAKNFPHRVEHWRYAGAGHLLGAPNAITTVGSFTHPVTHELCELGGTPEGTARARADSWPRMLAFLRESLAPAPQP